MFDGMDELGTEFEEEVWLVELDCAVEDAFEERVFRLEDGELDKAAEETALDTALEDGTNCDTVSEDSSSKTTSFEVEEESIVAAVFLLQPNRKQIQNKRISGTIACFILSNLIYKVFYFGKVQRKYTVIIPLHEYSPLIIT